MAAENVVEKILADARVEAEKIKKQAQEREAAEHARLDEQLSRFQEQTQALARKAAEDERAHLLAAARMDIAKEYLAEKAKVLREVFEEARRRLQSLPEQEYRDLMVRLMAQAADTGEEEVVVSRNETRINQDLVNRVNQQLAAQGKGHLKLSGEKAHINGGFILRRGRIKTNVSYDVLLDRARQDLEIQLAKELFA
jgi:V/A-type H+-transporting ATPase subunit E